MSKLKLSTQLSNITRNYRLVKDTEGMSPACVYKLIGLNENLYLKISNNQYHGTTYDVEREKDIMLWLKGKLPVPEVLYFERYENENFLLMREIEGVVGYEDYEKRKDPNLMVNIYSESVRLFQSIDISDCPFDNSINNRLKELEYLLSHNLAAIDSDNWEDDTPFKTPDELYSFLQSHKPNEELVFSHGDIGDSNLFIKNRLVP